MKQPALLSCLVGAAAARVLLPIEHDYSHISWTDAGAADADQIVVAELALHQPHLDRARDYLTKISDPASDHFGRHLGRFQTERLFAPSSDALAAVSDWLAAAGIPEESFEYETAGTIVKFQSTVAAIEDLFETKCRVYRRHVAGLSETHTSCSSPVSPKKLTSHVEHIAISSAKGTSPRKKTSPYLGSSSLANTSPVLDRRTAPPPYKGGPSRHGSKPNLGRCAESWTPECIRQLYQIPSEHTAAPNNSIGVYGFADLYNQTDLNAFFKRLAPFIPSGTTPNTVKINAGTAIYTNGEESLDLQMAYPIVWPQNVTLYQVDDLGALQFPGFGNHFLDAVDGSYCTFDGGDDPDYDEIYPDFSHPKKADCGTIDTVTNVLAISYDIDELEVSKHYVNRQCNEWMKLALRGVSVVVASGDRGVKGIQRCGAKVPGTDYYGFSTVFPASCPHVTSVGATQINFTSADGTSWKEVAVDDPIHQFWSGGGFSAYNARPSYQDDAVAKFFTAHDPHYPNVTFNRQGRALPDVSMLGALVTIVDQGNETVSGGTSAAAPLFASMINRINDIRLLAGKRPVGFLNNILYKHPEVFTDITEGYNPGCNAKGFNATTGWDPVSGLGSPVYPKLRDLLVGLP